MAIRADGLLLTREEAAAAAMLAGAGVDALRRRNGTVPPAAVLLVDQLAKFGRRRTPQTQGSAVGEHANPADDCDPAISDLRIGVTEAAARLRVSEQAVRRFCRLGDLIAWRPAPGAAWIIDESTVDALAARRAAGE